MNLIKHMDITLHGMCGGDDLNRQALMLKKLLEDAGVEKVTVTNKVTNWRERHDDEIKLFAGAKPDTVSISLREYFIGG